MVRECLDHTPKWLVEIIVILDQLLFSPFCHPIATLSHILSPNCHPIITHYHIVTLRHYIVTLSHHIVTLGVMYVKVC